MKTKQRKLTKDQRWLLGEALRRFLRFGNGKGITQAWTGLGSYSQYKSALDAGYMTYATKPNPGHMTWWKLSRRGALIVRRWINAGVTYQQIEEGTLPE